MSGEEKLLNLSIKNSVVVNCCARTHKEMKPHSSSLALQN